MQLPNLKILQGTWMESVRILLTIPNLTPLAPKPRPTENSERWDLKNKEKWLMLKTKLIKWLKHRNSLTCWKESRRSSRSQGKEHRVPTKTKSKYRTWKEVNKKADHRRHSSNLNQMQPESLPRRRRDSKSSRNAKRSLKLLNWRRRKRNRLKGKEHWTS